MTKPTVAWTEFAVHYAMPHKFGKES